MSPVFANYEIEALIGRGGMAEVYRAKALEGPWAGRHIALKRLLPSLALDSTYVDLFTSEADITRHLHHPNIVEVLETGVVGETYYIAMEYVDGRNLKQIINQCASRPIFLPVDFATFVAHVVAQALDCVHTVKDALGKPLDLIHCDVSPSNVFISKLGEIKLGDFGVARFGSRAAPADGAFGKVHYLAPEQILGRAVGPTTDLFALGAILFELLTLRHAFPGKDANEVGQKILGGEVQPPSTLRLDLPPALDALIVRALSLEPGDRPASAAALAEELGRLYDPAIGTPLAIAAVVRGLFGVA
jgi:serine/threonine protein kinase